MEEGGEGQHGGPLVQAAGESFPRVVQSTGNGPEARKVRLSIFKPLSTTLFETLVSGILYIYDI